MSRAKRAVVVLLFASAAAHAGVVTQYSFEGSLLDTAPAGGTVDNLTGYAATGPLAVSYASGIVGQAVLVSRDPGEATVLQAASSPDLQLAPSWTVEAFVRPDSANTGLWDRFATKWFDGSNEWHWSFRYGNNGQDLFVNGVPAIDGAGTGTVPVNAWSHVAMTGSPADGIRLWQDGAVIGTAPYQAVTPGSDLFRIGNYNVGDTDLQFSGLVDEFLIHDAAQDGTYMLGRAALLPAPPPPPPPPPPPLGLVSFYSFEGNTNDVAGNFPVSTSTFADDLTPADGAPSYVAGQVGQALRVGVQAGDTTYLTAPVSADVNLPSIYTIEAWINPTELTDTWQRLVLNWGSEFAYHFAIRNGSGYANAVSLFHQEDAGGGQPSANGGTVVAGEWQHIAGVADGSLLRVYLNGVEVGSAPYDGSINTVVAEGLGVGDSATSLSGIRFNGLLDELAMWDVALSPEHIAAHYNAGAEGYGLDRSDIIPEPASLALLAMGGLGLLRRRRRTR